jgi:hypothetical protein
LRSPLGHHATGVPGRAFPPARLDTGPPQGQPVAGGDRTRRLPPGRDNDAAYLILSESLLFFNCFQTFSMIFGLIQSAAQHKGTMVPSCPSGPNQSQTRFKPGSNLDVLSCSQQVAIEPTVAPSSPEPRCATTQNKGAGHHASLHRPSNRRIPVALSGLW